MSNIPSNYHTHSTFCDGKDTPEEMVLECPLLPALTDVGLQGLIADDNVVILGVLLQLHHQLSGMDHINEEHAVEHSDEEGKGQIVGQPQ